MTQEKFDEIINLERGNRPDNVLEYLPKEYVDAHLALFKQEGGSFIVIEKAGSQAQKGFPTFPARKFVGLRSDMEKIVEEY